MRIWRLTVAVIVLSALPVAQDVGELAKLRNVEWIGVKAVATSKLVFGLVAGPGYADSSYPEVKFSDFAANLKQSLRSRYSDNGYFETKVNVSNADGRLRIVVDEGERTLIGALWFEGNSVMATERLREIFSGKAGTSLPANLSWDRGRKISKAERAHSSELWVPGEAPKLGTLIERVQKRIEYAYSLIGHERTETEVKWSVSPKTAGLLDLHVRILSEGEAQDLTEIRVTGDDREFVIAAAGLTDGLRWTLPKQHEIERRLYATCRYFDVRCDRGPSRTFTIDVKKAGFAPDLVDMPVDVLSTLKRGRTWILHQLENGGSFRITPSKFSDEWPPATLLIGKRGFSLEMGKQEAVPAFSLRIRNGGAQLSFPDIGARIVLPEGTSYQQIQFTLQTGADGGSLQWGASIQAKETPLLATTITDATLLRLAMEGKPSWTEAALSAEIAGVKIVIDRKTGRVDLPGLRGFEFLLKQEMEPEDLAPRTGGTFTTVVINGDLDLALLIDLISRFSSHYLQQPLPRPEVERLVLAGSKWLSPLLDSFDQRGFEASLSIPQILDYKRLIPRLGRVLGREMADGSWPEAILWHGMNLISAKSESARRAAWGQFTVPVRSEDAGPLGSLAMIAFLEYTKVAVPAVVAISRYGLSQLTFDSVWRDLLALQPNEAARKDAISAFGTIILTLLHSGALPAELSAQLRALPESADGAVRAKAFAEVLWETRGQAWFRSQFERRIK